MCRYGSDRTCSNSLRVSAASAQKTVYIIGADQVARGLSAEIGQRHGDLAALAVAQDFEFGRLPVSRTRQ
jgi:hypothetical protein